MGPFNLMTQLERKAHVLAVLQRNDLSAWARNYWGIVHDNLAMDEDRYNARVVTLFKDLTPTPKGYISYE
jgi:hypothetical protein